MRLRPSERSGPPGPFAQARHHSFRRAVRLFRLTLPVLVLLPCLSLTAHARQVDTTQTPPPPASAATPPEAAARADTTVRRDAADADASTLTDPVHFSARDSLVIAFDEAGDDRGRLVNEAHVSYRDVELHAHMVDILFDIEELRASGLPTDSGYVGLPQFQQGGEAFSGTRFAYNLGTERGRVVGARTEFEEGFIEAGVVKVTEDSTLYVLNGAYTTCDCGPGETPSYSLRARKMKVVDQEWIYTGPIQLFIFNIPTPFWLPFGFLPAQEGCRSGPLPPEYGEDQRGFYLRNWGYYWAINDYMDFQVRAGIWTKGSWQINPIFRYSRRYRYNGSVSVDFLRETSGEQLDPGRVVRNTGRIRWTHSQELNPTARLSANVDLSSSSYLRTVSEQYDDRVRQEASSNISYSKTWPRGKRSLSLSLRQRQVFATNTAELTLPQVSFVQSTRTPFARENRPAGQDARWYERISFSYSGRLDNHYSFNPLPTDSLLARGDTAAVDISWYEALFSPNAYERATGDATPYTFRASHRIPVSAPFNISRLPIINRTVLLNVNPSLDYSEEWFTETERRVHDDSTGRDVRRTEPGFFALRRFSTSLSANTTIYGIFPVGAGPYQGIRHTLRPSLGFSYQPDFFDAFWGYTRLLRTTDGDPVIDVATGEPVRYAIVSSVPRGEQRALTFSLSNVFETKHVSVDSTGEARSRPVKLFDLNLSSSYNFAADSMRLAPISVSARTNVLGRLSLNLSAILSPYAVVTDAQGQAREIDRYVFSLRNARFARLTRLSIQGSFRLRRGGQLRRTSPWGGYQTTAADLAGASSLGTIDPFAPGDPGYGVDFSIPWDLGVRFTYSLNRSPISSSRIVTVNTDFSFMLTPNWQVSGQTGYDLERRELVTTTLNIHRDLGCWQMAFRWTPFGQFQSWGFDLHVKSGKLRDLLRIRQPRRELDPRFDAVF